jgi:hypothetical protein
LFIFLFLFTSTSAWVAQLYTQAPGSVFVVFYFSQGNGGFILPPHGVLIIRVPDKKCVSFSLQLLTEIFLFSINNVIRGGLHVKSSLNVVDLSES